MKRTIFTIALTLLMSLSNIYAQDNTPTFVLSTTNNKTINVVETKKGLDFKEFRGKAVLLVLFGHNCPPCLREIPEFIRLKNNHKNNLAIVAIESQGYPSNNLKSFVQQHKMNYNVVAGINHSDFISYIAMKAGYDRGIPLPLLISIDKYGEVQGVQAGQLREYELESLVADLNK